MKLIFGLGNPGVGYQNTRHNVGFQLLDFIANERGVNFFKNRFNGAYAEIFVRGEKVLLIKPLSFMNLSGSVVSKFVNFYKVDLNDILVVHDDLDMNFGRVKFVYNSSSGGHNGIKDIERCLGSKEYARLKIGIAHDKSMDTKDYVLGKFSLDEQEKLNDIYKELCSFVDDFCNVSFESLMSKYNHK